MIRFSSLFLALNILICYGGFCRDSFAAVLAPQAKVSSGCHGMSHEVNHESAKTGEENTAGIMNAPENADDSCCMEVLTNTSPDLNSRIEVVRIDRTQKQIPIQDRNYLEQLRDNSLRGHDPPDLQITNSIFLL